MSKGNIKMKHIVKQIQVNNENMKAYFAQSSIIRRTNTTSNTNYGKIVAMTDADVDG